MLEPLGVGGMGEVHLAEDTRLGRRVAIKLLSPAVLAAGVDADALLAEARTAASLNHPNVCTVYEVGEADGRSFVALEYVEGRPLSEAIAEQEIGIEMVIRYGLQIADALAHAHDHGIVHRDLKPANVRLTHDGRPKVLDFGLAVRLTGDELERSAESRATVGAVSSTVGTLQYMAPEVFRGGTADRHSDIWSLGVVLYEMAAGHLPFAGETVFELSSSILRDSPGPLPPEVPAGLRIVINRCLAKEPSRRYGRASEIRAALEMLEATLGEPAATPIGASAPAPPAGAVAGAQPHRRADARAPGGPSSGASMDRPGGGTTIRSLAVLPLTDLSDDRGQAYFSDGMTEALITDLAKLGDLKVISRTSVMRYRDTSEPLPRIAEELGVEAIVEGSVLRAGDRVRISAQLIHAATDSHLWADSYERDVSDVLALQRDVAQAIASEVRGSLEPTDAPGRREERAVTSDRESGAAAPGAEPVTSHPTVDPAAYEAVLQARSYINQQTVAGLKSAAMWVERALERDPGSGLAHSTLAMLRITEAIYGEEKPPREVMPEAADAARRGLELDPQSAEANLALGMLQFFYDWHWEVAEGSFLRAQQLNLDLSDTHEFYGYFLAACGRREEAVVAAERATDLDPLSPLAHADLSTFLLWAGRLDGALRSARRSVEVDPGRWRGHWALGMALLARGTLDEAMAAFREGMRVSGGGSLVQTSLGQALIAQGDRQQAVALKEDLEARRRAGYVSAYLLAALEASLGHPEEALAWLERGLEERTFYMVFLKVVAPIRFAAIQDDARFRRIVEQVGIP